MWVDFLRFLTLKEILFDLHGFPHALFLNGTLSFKVVYGVPESSSKYIEENLSIGNGQRTNIPLSVNSPLNRKETGFLQSVLLTFALLCHIFLQAFSPVKK